MKNNDSLESKRKDDLISMEEHLKKSKLETRKKCIETAARLRKVLDLFVINDSNRKEFVVLHKQRISNERYLKKSMNQLILMSKKYRLKYINNIKWSNQDIDEVLNILHTDYERLLDMISSNKKILNINKLSLEWNNESQREKEINDYLDSVTNEKDYYTRIREYDHLDFLLHFDIGIEKKALVCDLINVYIEVLFNFEDS